MEMCLGIPGKPVTYQNIMAIMEGEKRVGKLYLKHLDVIAWPSASH
jgi:hypothetical protein